MATMPRGTIAQSASSGITTPINASITVTIVASVELERDWARTLCIASAAMYVYQYLHLLRILASRELQRGIVHFV